MKTRIMPFILALGMLILPLDVSAQTTDTQFGIKGGINLSTLSGINPDIEKNVRLGPAAGFAGRYWVSPVVALQVETLYNQKGVELESGGILPQDRTVRLDYIEFPVLTRFEAPLSRDLIGGVYIGPSVGVPITGKVETGENEADLEDLSTDFGFNLGVDVGSGPFYVDARYVHGLSGINQRGRLGQENRVFRFTFGYWFN